MDRTDHTTRRSFEGAARNYYFYVGLIWIFCHNSFPKDPPIKTGWTSFWSSVSTYGRETLMIWSRDVLPQIICVSCSPHYRDTGSTLLVETFSVSQKYCTKIRRWERNNTISSQNPFACTVGLCIRKSRNQHDSLSMANKPRSFCWCWMTQELENLPQ